MNPILLKSLLGIALTGGVTAIAITKNKNSSSQEKLDSNAHEIDHTESDIDEKSKSPIQERDAGTSGSVNPEEISHTTPSPSATTLALNSGSPDSESETLRGVDSNSVDTAKAKK